MIINNRYRFIYLHVPKTAGTTVSTILNQLSGPTDIDIGGVLQPVEFKVTQKEKVYSSVVDLSFSMFEIVPPSAMFGQIKCGDNLSVSFELTY